MVMKSHMLSQFENSLGIQLPPAMKQFLLNPQELEYYRVLTLEEFTSLDRLYPGLPTRTLPFLEVSTGDTMALYLPRLPAKPLVVFFSGDESRITPLTADFDALFTDPDLYAPEYEKDSDGDGIHTDSPDAWRELLYDTHSECAETELLKPLAFNSSHEAASDKKVFKKLKARFGCPLEQAGIIRKRVSDVSDLLDRQWWFDLADNLAQAGFWREAIMALDNSQITHFISPHHGSTKEKTSLMFLWLRVSEVFERMMPLIQEHGDAFDRVTVPHLLRQAQEFAARRQAQEFAADESDESKVTDSHQSPKNSSSDAVDGPLAINLDICLADLVSMSDQELAAITGTTDAGETVSTLPIAETGDSFFIEVGDPAVIVSLEFIDNSYAIGDILQDLAIYLRDDYLPYPKKSDQRNEVVRHLYTSYCLGSGR